MGDGETVVGAIDVGSNTIHLAVVVVVADGSLRYLADETELVRLGQDVSASGSITPERMDRAVAVVAGQARRSAVCGAETTLGIATEGVRAASNGDELIRRVERECGLRLRLISGEQEAALTYWGATWPWASSTERQAALDLGGGSLEIVVGEARRIVWRVSLPLGSGAVYARRIHSDPPTSAELAEVDGEAAATLATVAPPLPFARVVACGGTATTLLRLAEIGPLDGFSSGDETLSLRMLDAAIAYMRRQPAAQLQAVTGIEEARLRLIGPGAVVLRAAARRLGASALSVSRAGIREGAALAYAHAGESWPDLAARGDGW